MIIFTYRVFFGNLKLFFKMSNLEKLKTNPFARQEEYVRNNTD